MRLVELDHAHVRRKIVGHAPDRILADAFRPRLGDDQLHIGIEGHVLRGGRAGEGSGDSGGEREKRTGKIHVMLFVTRDMTRQ